MTPVHRKPTEDDWAAHKRNCAEIKMRFSVTKAAVEWAEGKRSTYSLKTRVQYWLRKVASTVR